MATHLFLFCPHIMFGIFLFFFFNQCALLLWKIVLFDRWKHGGDTLCKIKLLIKSILFILECKIFALS